MVRLPRVKNANDGGLHVHVVDVRVQIRFTCHFFNSHFGQTVCVFFFNIQKEKVSKCSTRIRCI